MNGQRERESRKWMRPAGLAAITLGATAFFVSGVVGGGGDVVGAFLAGACNPLFFIGFPLGCYWLYRSGFASLFASDNSRARLGQPLFPPTPPPPILSPPGSSEPCPQLSYNDWYERTTAALLGSDLPQSFIEHCLTDRAMMQRWHQEGFGAAEVLMHLSKEYREQMAQRKAERKQLNAEARSYVYKWIAIVAIVICAVVMGILALDNWSRG